MSTGPMANLLQNRNQDFHKKTGPQKHKNSESNPNIHKDLLDFQATKDFDGEMSTATVAMTARVDANRLRVSTPETLGKTMAASSLSIKAANTLASQAVFTLINVFNVLFLFVQHIQRI